MTGFGKTACQLDNKNVIIELKTLNSKTIDITLKLPSLYKGFEQELRNMLSSQLVRGKIELYIGFENASMPSEAIINHDFLERHYLALTALSEKLNVAAGPELFAALLRLPEAFNQAAQVSGDDDWELIKPDVQQAIDQTMAYRTAEGKNLEADLQFRINTIGNLLTAIQPLEDARRENLKNRLMKGLQELSDNSQPDPNRFEQELIYYLEKLDISEEKVRLSSHLQYFQETMKEPEPAGKKLGFIAQEIGREVNTIGSKANDANMQRLVVQMKDELEKIKEQLMNIL